MYLGHAKPPPPRPPPPRPPLPPLPPPHLLCPSHEHIRQQQQHHNQFLRLLNHQHQNQTQHQHQNQTQHQHQQHQFLHVVDHHHHRQRQYQQQRQHRGQLRLQKHPSRRWDRLSHPATPEMYRHHGHNHHYPIGGPAGAHPQSQSQPQPQLGLGLGLGLGLDPPVFATDPRWMGRPRQVPDGDGIIMAGSVFGQHPHGQHQHQHPNQHQHLVQGWLTGEGRELQAPSIPDPTFNYGGLDFGPTDESAHFSYHPLPQPQQPSSHHQHGHHGQQWVHDAAALPLLPQAWPGGWGGAAAHSFAATPAGFDVDLFGAASSLGFPEGSPLDAWAAQYQHDHDHDHAHPGHHHRDDGRRLTVSPREVRLEPTPSPPHQPFTLLDLSLHEPVLPIAAPGSAATGAWMDDDGEENDGDDDDEGENGRGLHHGSHYMASLPVRGRRELPDRRPGPSSSASGSSSSMSARAGPPPRLPRPHLPAISAHHYPAPFFAPAASNRLDQQRQHQQHQQQDSDRAERRIVRVAPPPPPPPPPGDDRTRRDEYLLAAKRSGMTYREIKAHGGFSEAESTLRGRYRTLTKSKEARVRKPEWAQKDMHLLDKAIRSFCKGEDPAHVKISWKFVAEYIVSHGGSYHFGNATCRKKADELGLIGGGEEEEAEPEAGITWAGQL